MPLATSASGSRKVSKKQVEDFISSKGKGNSKSKKEKHKSLSYQRQEKKLGNEAMKKRVEGEYQIYL